MIYSRLDFALEHHGYSKSRDNLRGPINSLCSDKKETIGNIKDREGGREKIRNQNSEGEEKKALKVQKAQEAAEQAMQAELRASPWVEQP